ncbi:hypothetical protein NA56DRAFT_701780 [Hyaloscypha hepaticicola]|uniref:Uncharacterized protein n=1 Tax=Hyaloscypha hepaticicola TaxID=2082293 RepID=A0A2J6QB37_9HELO|nr:hypothetical protein NA56DRAFT_701780 [Hyaloscypha hepaticicola]
MKNLASERAAERIGLNGVILHTWFGISFGEYRWIWGHNREQSLEKRNTDSSSSGINAACTSWAVPLKSGNPGVNICRRLGIIWSCAIILKVNRKNTRETSPCQHTQRDRHGGDELTADMAF